MVDRLEGKLSLGGTQSTNPSVELDLSLTQKLRLPFSANGDLRGLLLFRFGVRNVSGVSRPEKEGLE